MGGAAAARVRGGAVLVAGLHGQGPALLRARGALGGGRGLPLRRGGLGARAPGLQAGRGGAALCAGRARARRHRPRPVQGARGRLRGRAGRATPWPSWRGRPSGSGAGRGCWRRPATRPRPAPERSEFWAQGAQLHAELREHRAAGELHERAEQWREAAECYRQGSAWDCAARAFGRAGLAVEAAECEGRAAAAPAPAAADDPADPVGDYAAERERYWAGVEAREAEQVRVVMEESCRLAAADLAPLVGDRVPLEGLAEEYARGPGAGVPPSMTSAAAARCGARPIVFVALRTRWFCKRSHNTFAPGALSVMNEVQAAEVANTPIASESSTAHDA